MKQSTRVDSQEEDRGGRGWMKGIVGESESGKRDP